MEYVGYVYMWLMFKSEPINILHIYMTLVDKPLKSNIDYYEMWILRGPFKYMGRISVFRLFHT